MYTFILKENVLTDNLLLLAEKNHIFKGGYIAIIKEYEYLNELEEYLSNMLWVNQPEERQKEIDKIYIS